MAKIRKSASIERGIEEVVKILSEEEIQQAIGKSVSYLRKCSDPDQPQQIDHNDSFKLDKACIEKSKAPPLLTAHEYMISQEFEKLDPNKTKNINDMLVKFTPNDSDWYVALYGKNIADDRQLQFLRTASNLQGGQLYGSFSDPRTWGLQFGFEF